jgi:hypothetical protein
MKLIKLNRNQLITLLDIFIIVVVIIFVKAYMVRNKVNYSELKEDNVKYIFRTDKPEYFENEIVQFIFSIENKSKKEIEFNFERLEVFNLIIEKEGVLVFKRDMADSLTDGAKKIIIKRYGEKDFTYEWYMNSNTDYEIEKGKYEATLYSLDLKIKIPVEFIIK